MTSQGTATVGPNIPLNQKFASVQFSSDTVTVAAGETQSVSIDFTPPAEDSTTLPVYSGFIEIASADDAVKVTYMGVAGKLKDKSVFDTSNRIFGMSLPTLLAADGNPQTNSTTYTLGTNDTPTVLYR